jgi:hypothetical protein
VDHGDSGAKHPEPSHRPRWRIAPQEARALAAVIAAAGLVSSVGQFVTPYSHGLLQAVLVSIGVACICGLITAASILFVYRGRATVSLTARLAAMLAVALVAFGILGGRLTGFVVAPHTPQVQDVNCAGFVRSYVTWSSDSPSVHVVGFTMITSQAANPRLLPQPAAAASYAEGVLTYSAASQELTGDAPVFYSDRILRSPGFQPFDRSQTDQIRLKIVVSANEVHIVLTSKTYPDDGQELDNLRCSDGVITGIGRSVGVESAPSAVYVLSLGRQLHG